MIAVFGLGLAAGYDVATAARLANTAAGIVVTKLGAATVSLAELTRALRDQQAEAAMTTGVMTLDALKLALRQARLMGEKVVMTNGCFDLLHAGHVAYLEEAKKLGDRLIVAVNDDASVQRLKGPQRPVVPIASRLELLAALTAVDWVIDFSEDTPEMLIHELMPELLVKGGDYTPDQVVGASLVLAYGGEVRVIAHPFTHSCSTTQLLEKQALLEELSQ